MTNKKIFDLLIVILPFLMILLVINYFGIGIFYQDEWELPFLFEAIDLGNFSELWKGHNEHRLVLPKILFYINNQFEFDTKVLMYLSQIIHLCIAFILLKNIEFTKEKNSLLVLIFSLLLFSWVQSDNILWGFQLQWYLCLLGTIIFILGLSNFNHFLSIIGILIAYLSFSNWITLVPLIFFHAFILIILNKSYSIKKFLFHLSYLISFIFLLFIYLDNSKSSKVSLFLEIFQKPIEFIQYFLALLGGPFAWNLTSAMVFGFVFIILFFYILYHYHRAKVNNNFSLLILFWYITTTILISLARFNYGLDQALVPRFYTYTLTGWAVLLLITYNAFSLKLNYNKRLYILLFPIFITFISYGKGFLLINEDFRIKKTALSCYQKTLLVHTQKKKSCLKVLYPTETRLIHAHKVLSKINRIPQSWFNQDVRLPVFIEHLNRFLEEVLDQLGVTKSYKFNKDGKRH